MALDSLKTLIKQPYWVIALVIGAALVALPCITIDKDYRLATHSPNTWLLAIIGIVLLIISVVAFAYTLLPARAVSLTEDVGAGLDLTRVKEDGTALWTNVNGCEIRVVYGLLEEYTQQRDVAMVLPCNEYFDDRCINDTKSALGAYVNKTFEGQLPAFQALLLDECKKRLGAGNEQQKTQDECAISFGPGRCVFLNKPFDRMVAVALMSTTTQRASQGLSARISYLFDGMQELTTRLADFRINEIAMPLLGAGHGGISPPLALVGLLLALAEAAHYGQGGQRLKKVTIVIYRKDGNSPASVDALVIRRALALIASQG